MLDLRRIRPLDAAIGVAVVLVIIIGSYLAYSVYMNNARNQALSPVGRVANDLIAQVRENPDDLDLRMQLAAALDAAGRQREAIGQYEAILNADDEYAPALTKLGTIALQRQEFSAAEGYLRKASDILGPLTGKARDNELETVYFYLGTALMEQNEHEEAAGYFKEALRFRRDSSITHYLLAVSLREMGLEDAQRESLQNTLLFDPRHPEANYDYALLLLADGDVADAAERLRLSADAAPEADLPREELVKLGDAATRISTARSMMSSDRGQAIVEARVAVALDPKSVEGFVLLGDLFAAAKNEEKARDAYERALGIDPENEAAKAGLERFDDGS